MEQRTGARAAFLPDHLAASAWMMIVGYARVSTAEQNLGLEHDNLKPAFDASVDQTNGT